MSREISRIRIPKQIPPSTRYRVLDVESASLTLSASHSDRILFFQSDSAITVRVPNTLAQGWNTLLITDGDGDITLVGADDSPSDCAILRIEGDMRTTWGQYSWVSLFCKSNTDDVSAIVYGAGSLA